MTLPAVFLFLVMTLFLTSCGQGSDSQPVDTFATQIEARAGVPFAQEGAGVTLEVPPEVSVGEPVPIRILIRNETPSPMDLYLRGREPTFDIAVSDSTGAQVWRRLEGEVIQAIVQIRTVAPQETIELTDTWNQRSQRGDPVAAGRYTISATVLTDSPGGIVSNATTLTVTEP